MQEINWEVFKAKFSDKQEKFEWLCSILFAKEFNNGKGLFKYKNQTGIESEPLQIKGEWIGFQSKFYETKLVDNKIDLTQSIEKAKNKNPQLTKILFYTNQELTESRFLERKKSNFETEIEQYAKSKGVKIEWRTHGWFETDDICQDEQNEYILKYFFSNKKSIIELNDELSNHTENILQNIHSSILWNDRIIQINRQSTLNEIKLKNIPLIIVHGEAGTGKTALIKDLYDFCKESSNFYIFKATEFFDLKHENEIFKHYHNFSLSEFVRVYEEESEKYFVIDSAEKFTDLNELSRTVIQSFLQELIKSGWKVILTTRNSYLENLKNIVFDDFKLRFASINIPDLLTEQLEEITVQNNFKVPSNKRLKTLLRNPFYLNEYLQIYNDNNEYFDLVKFKDTLWRKRIFDSCKSQSDTEKCFLQIAKDRANIGGFIVQSNYDFRTLNKLVHNEVIQYHNDRQGYSISHDIYEEWALERIINTEFLNQSNYQGFFSAIGQSLPVRRSFRSWLSEKLVSDIENVKSFIRESIISNKIEQFWKDEILVSVLLSDYSESFFEIFETEIVEDYHFRSRIILLLQIACKEIDEALLNSLGLSHLDSTMKTSFLKPSGKGWSCFINFVHKKQKQIIFHLDEVIQILSEWNSKNKSGETTKKASEIALEYFIQLSNKDSQFGYSYKNEKRENLISIILNGASEIKDSLKSIFDLIIKKEIERGDSFYEIAKTVLVSSLESIEVIKILPEEILKVANLFWNMAEKEKNNELAYGGHFMDYWEVIFAITTNYDLKYFPSSSFQTPIYYLLHYHPQITIDFILSFVNKTVETYAKSGSLDGKIPEIDVVINNNKIQKQFISSRLWCSYRGTTVSPDLFQSIHMALEKWLLDLAKTYPKNIIESWCLYLLKNSKSASLSAVVASIAMAYQEKLFDIAKILFQTKEFFFFDAARLSSENSALAPLGADKYSHFMQKERLESNKLQHRQASLESLAFQYQFNLGQESENQIEKRRQAIWEIFDRYYKKLPFKLLQTEEDKTWRLFLARMDLRKMTPELVEQSNQRFIQFKPSLESDIEIISKEAQEELEIMNKFSALLCWSRFRFEGTKDKYEQYLQYENNPNLVIEETKQILDKLKDKSDKFNLFRQPIPAYSCSALIRNFANFLSDQEKNFCKDIIFQYANSLFEENYNYQIDDGVEASINTLPLLLKYFPEEKFKIKSILLLTLFNEYPVGYKKICDYSIEAIINNSLWEDNLEDANSIFLGYLHLYNKYKNLIVNLREELYKQNIYNLSFALIINRLQALYSTDLNRIFSNQFTNEINKLQQISLGALCTAFQTLPNNLQNTNQEQFIQTILPLFANYLFNKDSKQKTRDRGNDYMLKHRFLKKFSALILNAPRDKCEVYIKPFLDNFSNCDNTVKFFNQIIIAQDKFNQYENFWFIWNSFYDRIVHISNQDNKKFSSMDIIHTYLFAKTIWNEGVTKWHSLTDKQINFFEKVSKDIGHHPAVIYSFSKILNGIASQFPKEGISWICHILDNHSSHLANNLETDTMFYLEKFVRSFILNNRGEIKTNKQIKNSLVKILDFLVDNGSSPGYQLRESIL